MLNINISNSTIIKARIKSGENWSPLKQINLCKTNEDYSTLKVTELHYHPFDEIVGDDTIPNSDFEFIVHAIISESIFNKDL